MKDNKKGSSCGLPPNTTTSCPHSNAENSKKQPEVSFSVVKKIGREALFTKVMSLDKDGKVYKDSSNAWVSEGVLTRKNIPATEFKTLLRQLKQNEALVHGVAQKDVVGITTSKDSHNNPESIPRNKENIKYHEGPGVGLLDHDKPRDNAVGKPKALKSYSSSDLIQLLEMVDPEFTTSMIVSTPSTSACIYDKDGKELRGEGVGSHNYYFPENASLIPKYLKKLVDRLWLNGYGRYEISRCGSILPRTIVDQFVGSPERPDFCAGAVCNDGLSQKLPDPVERPGGLHNCSKLKELNTEETRQLKSIRRKLRMDAEPVAARVKAEYQGVEVEKLITGGMTKEKAQNVVRVRLEGLLHDSQLLYWNDGSECSVRDMFNDPEKYDEMSMADPLEPEYGGHSRTKAIFYWNDGFPIIFSHAHGGIRYKFCRNEGLFEWEEDLETLLKKGTQDAGVMYEDDSLWFFQNLMEKAKPTYIRNQYKIKEIVGGMTDFIKDVKSFERPVDKEWRDTEGIINAAAPACGAFERLDRNGKTTKKLIVMSEAKNIIIQQLGEHYCLHTGTDKLFKFVGTHWKGQDFNHALDAVVAAVCDSEAGDTGYTSNFLTGVVSMVKKSRELTGDPVKQGIIPFQNGILNVHTLELTETTKDNATSWCSPHDYNLDAKCPLFLKWLDWAVEQDQGTILVIQAFICLLLIGKSPTRMKAQKFLELIGGGGTGKSTFVRILGSLIGEDAVAYTDFKAVETNKFEIINLVGKALIVFGEAGWQGKVDNFKKITGDDSLRTEVKMVQGSTPVRIHGQIILLGNAPIKTNDSSDAIYRRRITIKIDKKPTEQEVRDWKGEQAIYAEGAGIINWALSLGEDKALDILKNTKSRRIEDSKLEAEIADKPLLRWMLDELVLKKDAVTQIGSAIRDPSYKDKYRHEGEWLYPTYCRWCHNNGYKKVTSQNFGSDLAQMANTYSLIDKTVERYTPGGKAFMKHIWIRKEWETTWREEWEKQLEGE